MKLVRYIFIFLLVQSSSFSFAQSGLGVKNTQDYKIKVCKKGPEDLIIDTTQGKTRLITGVGERKKWKKRKSCSSGGFIAVDHGKTKSYELKMDTAAGKYIPLGIKIISNDGTLLCNAVLCGTKESHIVSYNLKGDSIILNTVLYKGLNRFINNIQYDKNEGLFVSNFVKGTNTNMLLFRKGEVYHAEKLGSKLGTIGKLKSPNSFGISKGKVYLTSTINNYLFEIIKDESGNYSEIRKIESIPLKGGDNVNINNDTLTTTGSPTKFKALLHVKHPKLFPNVSSLIYEIDISDETPKYKRVILLPKELKFGVVSTSCKIEGEYYLAQVALPYLVHFKESDLVELKDDKVKGQKKRKNKYTRFLLRKHPDLKIFMLKPNPKS